MRVTVFTLFPEFFESPLATSLLGKAIRAGLMDIRRIDFRDYASDKHRTVDDTPYGGGPGMVLKPDPIVGAFEANPPLVGGARIYLTPWGRPLDQEIVKKYAQLPEIQLLCGRYEGVDERVVEGWIDESVSLGDFVLAGGEVAALAVIEAVSRFIPGVLGEPASLGEESFSKGLLEGPQYTRPPEFRGLAVPEVLLSGNHADIENWRRQQSLQRTATMRPDLLKKNGG